MEAGEFVFRLPDRRRIVYIYFASRQAAESVDRIYAVARILEFVAEAGRSANELNLAEVPHFP